MSEYVVHKSKWARIVKEMAGNKCVICGATGRLESHHIIPRSLAPNLENDIDNGICLCHTCHYFYHDCSYTNDGLNHVSSYKYWPEEKRRHYDMVQDFKQNWIYLVFPAEMRIRERLEHVAMKTGRTIDDVVIDAIEAQLTADGVTLDNLDN